jgi:hypothetical protein
MRSWSHPHSVPLVTGEIGVFEERLQPDREDSLAGSPIWLQMGTRFDFVRENHLDRFRVTPARFFRHTFRPIIASLRGSRLNHGSVCTSTESTAGRSRTTGDQLSPASAEAYTCPPVVPKYTPHRSSESTAMASRNTFT